MRNDFKIIHYDSDEAAKIVTLTGWLSSDGRFWGQDEHMARYSGCTHQKCDCGNITERGRTKCDDCSNKLHIERYNKKPFKEWDSQQFVYCEHYDKYFFNKGDLDDFIEEEEIDAQSLMLVICDPQNFGELNNDYWEDVLPENGDGELPKLLQEAVDNLNKIINTLSPASWIPGKYRTEYKPKI